jgi:exopolyphosphatase/pppGpp-phosphohydrolase
MRRDTSSVRRLADKLEKRTIALGVETLVRQSLRHEPPRPIELEQAIELTEAAVMPLAAQFAGCPDMVLQGLGASLIAHGLAAIDIAQMALTLDEVEALFNRLVSVSQGRQASQERLPTDARFFAALLMLREFMHHLHFEQVTLQTLKE